MYTTKEGKKYGSAYVGKRKDEEHAKSQGEMPKKDTDYEAPGQPEYESTSRDHTEDKVNTDTESPKGHDPNGVHSEYPSPHEVVENHGPAHMVTYSHDHENGSHSVHSAHADGHTHYAEYKDPALAYEAGGELQASDVKRRTHPSEQGASSEGDNDEVPQHEAADLA
jgi:hypothetical protein